MRKEFYIVLFLGILLFLAGYSLGMTSGFNLAIDKTNVFWQEQDYCKMCFEPSFKKLVFKEFNLTFVNSSITYNISE